MKYPVYSCIGPLRALRHDGQSAGTQEVDLFLPASGKEICVCQGGGQDWSRPLVRWPVADIRVLSGRLAASGPLRLGLEPDRGERLTLAPGPEREALAAWLRPAQREAGWRRLRRWGLACALVWALALALYLSGPALLALATGAVPRSMEKEMGRGARDQILGLLTLMPGVTGVNEAAGASPELAALVSRLEQGAPVDGYVFDVLVLDAGFVNAFALPGGYLILSSALIRDCASPDELAGVLAHEMAHVTRRHGLSVVLRQQTMNFMARLMGLGDNVAGNLLSGLLESSFSREQEREADRLGVERLLGAGINPMALGDFFERLGKRSDDSMPLLRYLSSHPLSLERRDAIRLALEESDALRKNDSEDGGRSFSPALDAGAWARLLALLGDCRTGS